MEDKNIRWGELVGGLLIVGCSIALVISFWARIAERPFLKFFVFNGVTAALFGLGLYSKKRWNLRSTSDGLLMTATLLVPLNFLAIAAFTTGTLTNDWLVIGGELVSIALFSILMLAAGQILTSEPVEAAPSHAPIDSGVRLTDGAAEFADGNSAVADPLPTASVSQFAAVPLRGKWFGGWLFALGVMVPSVMQLLIRRFVVGPEGWLPEILGALVLGFCGLTNCLPLWRTRNDRSRTIAWADAAFRLLGVTLFASLMAAGFLLSKTAPIVEALHRLAPLVCLAGAAPLMVGLAIWRRLTGAASQPQRTAGLSVAVAGVAALLAGVALAWPTPAVMLPAAILTVLVLIVVALEYELPELHLAAASCFALVWLMGWYVATGEIELHATNAAETWRRLLSGLSGDILLGPAAARVCAIAGAGSSAPDATFAVRRLWCGNRRGSEHGPGYVVWLRPGRRSLRRRVDLSGLRCGRLLRRRKACP